MGLFVSNSETLSGNFNFFFQFRLLKYVSNGKIFVPQREVKKGISLRFWTSETRFYQKVVFECISVISFRYAVCI